MKIEFAFGVCSTMDRVIGSRLSGLMSPERTLLPQASCSWKLRGQGGFGGDCNHRKPCLLGLCFQICLVNRERGGGRRMSVGCLV